MVFPKNGERKWVIYKITNPADRVYIGKSCSFASRMSAYRKGTSGACNQQPLLYNSLKKYGFINHKVEIIETFISDNDTASSKEMFWIRTNMSNLNKWRDGNGMNLSDGGEGTLGARFYNRVSPLKGTKLSEERKQQNREYNKAHPPVGMKGKKHSDETKKRMSDLRKGKPNYKLRGFKHSEKTIERSRISHTGIPSKSKGTSIWDEANRKRIGDSKRGNTYNKGLIRSDEVRNKIRNGKLKDSKGVVQYDLQGIFIKEFQSKRATASAVKISRNSLNKILEGVTKTPTRFIFKYKTPCL